MPNEEVRRLFDSEEREGKRTILRQAPRIFDDVRWVWKAYGILSSTRSRGDRGRAQPITIGEVESYAKLNGITGESAVELLEMVIELDRAYMKFVSEKEAEQAKIDAEIRKVRPETRTFGG